MNILKCKSTTFFHPNNKKKSETPNNPSRLPTNTGFSEQPNFKIPRTNGALLCGYCRYSVPDM